MGVVLGSISSISSCSVKYWIELVWIRGGILIEGIPFGVRSRSYWWLRAPVADSCYSVYSGQLPWRVSVTELGLNGQVCGFVLARRAPVRTFYTSNGGLLRDSSVNISIVRYSGV